jgi:hypothetical protein
MKIGFVFTNFNNSRFTREAIHSIFLNGDWKNIYVVVVDNHSVEKEIELLKEIKRDYPNIELILNCENLGYFGGLNVGIKYLRGKEEKVDHIIVGNNDIFFPNDFIASIYNNLSKFERHAIISPNIITLDGVHQNPHVVKKISKFREMIFDLYFMHYYLAVMIKKIAAVTKKVTDRKDEEQFEIAQTIYQGYGACYILGPIFFRHFDDLWAPTFLLGEEFFLSKQLESKKLELYYEPSINVKHHSHATTKKIPSKSLWEISRESHKLYRKYIKIWR